MKTKTFTPQDNINAKSHRRENNFLESYELLTVDKGEIKELASLRMYGTNSKNYACLWIHDSKTDTFCSGSGSAGGYGYHRPSAAAYEAFESSGITFNEGISGRGDRAIVEALEAIGKKLRPRNKTIKVLKAHA